MDEAEVKVIIKSLLGSSQVQMTQNDLHKLFREFAGMAIPYRQYGFSNCQDYLKSIPDTCIVSGVGPYAQVTAVLSSNSAHIVDMISKQKPIKQPRQQRPRSRPIIVQGRPFHAPQYPVPPRFQVQQRQSVAVCNVKPQYRNFHNQPSSSYNFKQNYTSPPANSSNNFKQKRTSPSAKSSYNFKQKRTSSRVNNTSDDVWDEISPSVNGHGYVVNTIHKELCEGVLHQENITKHVPEVPCKEELRDIEERNESIPESSASSFDHSLNYKVPYEIQENLKQLIHNFPDGLWLYNLLEEYKKLFGSELDYRKYNYVSLVQMCLSLNYIFIYKHLRKDGGKLYIANRPVPDDACGELLKLAEEAAEEKEVYVPCANAVPDVICYADNVMLPGDTIPAETMDLNNLYTPVMIAEVYDLSKFWFILADNDKKLEDLETDMETFYNVKYKYYEIPERLLQKGLFVIAYRAPRDYYRAVVVKILPYSVKVFCVDSGMVLETTRSTIYFMHKEFSQLSRQGLRGRLSGLMPPTKQEQWSRDAAFRFLQLVKESTLFGSVASTDDSQSDLIYELVLCDSSYAEDVFIHDILMAENYAVATEQEQRVDVSLYTGYTCIVENLHLYPTFSELEQHLVPNAMQMRRLIASRIPLYHIYPSYFKSKTEISITPDVDYPLKCFANRLACKDRAQLTENSSDYDTTRSASLSPINVDDSEKDKASSCHTSSEEDRDVLLLSCTVANEISTNPQVVTPPILKPPPGFDYSMRNPMNAMPKCNPTNYSAPDLSKTSGFSYQDQAGEAIWQYQQNLHKQLIARQKLAAFQQQLQWKQQLAYQRQFASNPFTSQLHENKYRAYPQSTSNEPCFNKNTLGDNQINFGNVQNSSTQFSTASNSNIDRNAFKYPGNYHQTNLSLNAVVNPKINIDDKISQLTLSHAENQLYLENIGRTIISPEKLPQPKKQRRNVITHALDEGVTIHIVLIMEVPCVIPIEIQEVFTGKVNAIFLRRYLNLSEITTSELRLERITEQFHNDLLEHELIKIGQITLEYTNLSYLPELIKCIINDDYEVPGFAKMLKTLTADSPIWNA